MTTQSPDRIKFGGTEALRRNNDRPQPRVNTSIPIDLDSVEKRLRLDIHRAGELHLWVRKKLAQQEEEGDPVTLDEIILPEYLEPLSAYLSLDGAVYGSGGFAGGYWPSQEEIVNSYRVCSEKGFRNFVFSNLRRLQRRCALSPDIGPRAIEHLLLNGPVYDWMCLGGIKTIDDIINSPPDKLVAIFKRRAFFDAVVSSMRRFFELTDWQPHGLVFPNEERAI